MYSRDQSGKNVQTVLRRTLSFYMVEPDLRVLAASTGRTGRIVSVYDRGYAQIAFHEPVREPFENRERMSHAVSPVLRTRVSS